MLGFLGNMFLSARDFMILREYLVLGMTIGIYTLLFFFDDATDLRLWFQGSSRLAPSRAWYVVLGIRDGELLQY